MLRDLHVRNLAVIAEAAVEFGSGLNVLTGETGAGKSIVVDALALLAGARASSDLVRTGADLLSVTGVFEPAGSGWREPLERSGVDASISELVIRREISRGGRNRVFLNDQPVTLGLVVALAPWLIRIHTQREELGLVSAELQRRWLDRSAGEAGSELLRGCGAAHAAHARLAERLDRAVGDERLRNERMDLLRFQLSEIDAAKLEIGEDEALRRERDLLRHSEAIREALGESFAALFENEGSAVERLSQATRHLLTITEWQPASREWVGQLEGHRIGLEELARSVGESLERIDSDPRRLDAVEDRLAVVERLCRKYAETSGEVLDRGRAMADELAQLETDLEQKDDLAAEVGAALASFRKAAEELSRARRSWGETLAERVRAELGDLALPKARFAVELTKRRREGSPLVLAGEPTAFSAEGFDHVSFLLSANPGEELQPLARAASGGELSRIYLGLQLAVRSHGSPETPTLVFDEVDAGIGGAEAEAVGRKLKRLSRGGQILAVTHLPQVASHSDSHFKVVKGVDGGRTRTAVEPLARKNRIDEVARMLGGEKITDLTRSHAEEMIAGAESGE